MRRIILSMMVGIFLSIQAPAAQAAAPPGRSGAIIAALPGPEGARSWLEECRADLVAAVLEGPPGTTRSLEARLAGWREASVYLARNAGETDTAKGFIIYPPRTSLALFLLARAESMYAAALQGRDIPAVDQLFRFAGQPLTESTPAKYPSIERARAALAALPVPGDALRGYRVFLLPFSMGETSGQGGPGFMVLAAEPRDQELIPNQLEVTLVHEFGHYLHLAGMPRETLAGRKRWQTYLSLRGLDWQEDGPVNTDRWARSPEETFAEDFRLLFGGPSSSREPAATRAGDPRDDEVLASSLRRFMLSLAAGIQPPQDPAPWPEGNDARLSAGGSPDPSVVLFLAAAAATLAIGRYRKKGAGRRPSPISSSWSRYL